MKESFQSTCSELRTEYCTYHLNLLSLLSTFADEQNICITILAIHSKKSVHRQNFEIGNADGDWRLQLEARSSGAGAV